MNTGPAQEMPLTGLFRKRIKREGPITVRDYMETCLYHPEHGYYRTRPAIGAAGDFVTAPEISQVFGELIGLWCAVVWQQMGCPERVRLIEIGPGRGTMMADALRAARLVAPFRRALEVCLVETNDVLVRAQKAALADCGAPLNWFASIETIDAGPPAVVVANELLDTIPVEQHLSDGNRWTPRRIILTSEGSLAFAPGDDVAERQDFTPLIASLARLGSPIAALLIDYGTAGEGEALEPWGRRGDTLQAVRAHAHEHPLASPGAADLTVQVDFNAFRAAVAATAGEHLVVDGPVPQGEFLGRLGIIERAARLMSANPDQASSIEAGIARLIAPEGMGSRFKVIGLRSPGLPPLPALEDADRLASARS